VIFFLANELEPGSSEGDMKSYIYVPNSLREARCHVRVALADSLDKLTKQNFIRAWSSLAYLYPGLHPDGYEDAENGWPRVLHRFAAEAWRRAKAGKLSDDELYPSDAQWSGLFDRMRVHHPEETERRQMLAARFGGAAHA
jgi:hypothetical protein